MIPLASQSLGHLATRIATDLIPKAPDDYAATDLTFITFLISMAGQDFDRFADVRVSEEALMRKIFAAAAPHLADADLTRRIDAAATSGAASLKAPDLNARADLTTRLLIDVHAAVETAMDGGEAWAAALNDQIWTFLDDYAARRAYEVPF